MKIACFFNAIGKYLLCANSLYPLETAKQEAQLIIYYANYVVWYMPKPRSFRL